MNINDEGVPVLPRDPEGEAWRILSAKRLSEAYSDDEEEYLLEELDNKEG